MKNIVTILISAAFRGGIIRGEALMSMLIPKGEALIEAWSLL